MFENIKIRYKWATGRRLCLRRSWKRQYAAERQVRLDLKVNKETFDLNMKKEFYLLGEKQKLVCRQARWYNDSRQGVLYILTGSGFHIRTDTGAI